MENNKRFCVMLDCSRNAVMKPEKVKEFILTVKKFGYNSIMLYLEDTYEVCGEPLFGYLRGRYTKEEYITLYNKLKKALPYSSITTDIIVAFPGETESDFKETLEVVNACKYDSAFTFIFSPRIGTPACRMQDNLTIDEKNRRLQELNELVNKYAKEANDNYLNKVVKVLLEGPSEKGSGMLMGYTDTMKLVNVKASDDYIGKIVNVEITDVKTWSMDGKIVS